MLSVIRQFAKSWFAKLLFVVLIASFGVWGVRDMVHPKFSDAVVTAGSHEIHAEEFKQAFQKELEKLSQQQGQPISTQDAVNAGLDQRMLGEIANEASIAEYAQRIGLTPSVDQVTDAIRAIPGFQGPNGKFDPQTFTQTLAQNGITPARLQSEIRDDLAVNQLSAGLAAGFHAPKTYTALFAVYQQETRDLDFFVLDPHAVPQPPLPTDAQLQAFINQHADAFKRPEMRQLSVVRLSAKALAPSMPVDPAALQTLYDFRKAAAATPEKRSLIIIPVKTAADGAKAAAALKAGQDPAAVAKSVGAQPMMFASVIQSAVADPKLAAAAFAMKAGDVQGPVQGSLGMGVIKLNDVTPAHTPSLDDMRAQLEPQVRTDAAGKKVYDLMRKYEDAHDGGANLAAAAKAAGIDVQAIGPITADGMDVTGAKSPALTPKLLRDAFKLSQGGESDMEAESSGEYYAVRVEQVIPPHVPALAEIKPDLTKAYMVNQMRTALQAKADALVARLSKGEAFASVAASAGVKPGHAAGLTRAALSQNQQLNPQLAAKIFGGKKGDAFDGPTDAVHVMVAQIAAAGPPPIPAAAAMTVQGVEPVSGQVFQDLEQALENTARARIKPTLDQAQAREALGLPAAGGPAKPAAPAS